MPDDERESDRRGEVADLAPGPAESGPAPVCVRSWTGSQIPTR